MNQSEQINEIAAALAKSQGAFINPPRNREVKVKTKAGDTYTFTYATLDVIMDMIRGPLASNGLALVHLLESDDQGPICETRLLHVSGQWLSTWVPVIVAEGANAQGWGSALTYARRYGLCTLLGIAADEDDDANASCGNEARAKPRGQKPAEDTNPAVNAQKKAREALERAENSKALLAVAENIRASKVIDPAGIEALVGYAAELMLAKIDAAIKGAKTADDAEKYAKFYGSCWLFTPEKRTEIVAAFGAVREGLTPAS